MDLGSDTFREYIKAVLAGAAGGIVINNSNLILSQDLLADVTVLVIFYVIYYGYDNLEKIERFTAKKLGRYTSDEGESTLSDQKSTSPNTSIGETRLRPYYRITNEDSSDN